jgi:ubiquinone/menaquinone biosynthesis C-methylase UbiE
MVSMSENFWDNLMGSDEGAANYMNSYGEGPGYTTRMAVGEFINDGETVLDVGCGPAWNFDHFMEYGPKVIYTGQDYSSRFVRTANKRIKEKYGVKPIALGDIRKIHEPNESFDVVIMQDCLEHTNGYVEPIEEALRVAKRRVIVTFWHLKDEGPDQINDDGDDGYGAWYGKPDWEKFLNSLPYVWHSLEVAPGGKTHKWDFYIIDKENS